LSGANLKDARLISRSGKEPGSLTRANLKCAKLNGAILCRTDLEGADLKEANLEGANPERAIGLTTKQLKWTIGDIERQNESG